MASMTQQRKCFAQGGKFERSFDLKPTKKSPLTAIGMVLGLAFLLVPAAGFAQNPAEGLLQNQGLLLKARHSLMGQDVVSAERYVEEAARLNPTYSDADDRPEYVTALINEYKQAAATAQSIGMTESSRRALASSYLNQAEALRRCRDYDRADALVSEAVKLDVVADAVTVQNQMDAVSIAQRIRDDRLAAETLAAPIVAQASADNLSEAAKSQIAAVSAQVVEARRLLCAGRIQEAEAIARQLSETGLPENVFADGNSPKRLLGEIAVVRSAAAVPAFAQNTAANEAPSVIRQVQGLEITAENQRSNGYLYVQEADTALSAGNKEAALTNYRDALRYESELDGETLKRIHDAIARLSNPIASAPAPEVGATGIDLNRAPQDLQSDISAFISKSYQLRKTDPNKALAQLKQLRAEIEQSNLDSAVKSHFFFTLDTAIAETNRFIDINGPMIALDNQNKDVEERLREQREEEVQIQNRLAEDTRLFEQLIEDGKYDEAEILAKKCQDYSHGDVVSIQMVQRARIVKQVAFNTNLKAEREAGWLGAMNDVESASVINVTDANPLAYGPQWERAKNRKGYDSGSTRSEADMAILNQLDMRITLPFDRPMPLGTVLEYIADTMKINVLQDERAYAEVGITSDTPVETKLTDISLKNYLKHILSPYDLTYVVADEALTVTSKSRRGGEPTRKVYYVGDLVTPIPNFNSVNNPLSVQSSFDRSFKSVRQRSDAPSVSNTIPGIADNMFTGSMIAPNILAQIQAAGNSAPISSGAAGGGSDPSELIGLITELIDPESWEEVGDPQFYSMNNSLIIRQSEQNHAEIKDLLEKLRSLMDLQIAVEVRYVSISDEYFERIGVNFGATFKTSAPSVEGDYGLEPAGKGIYGITTADAVTGKPFTETLNVDFSQNNYGLAVPQFGNYDPSVGAQIGFAILSDIETFFFVSAAEVDRRTNVLQAPKVMMFNGQTATVSDVTQVPYVYTVIPVVGDFAVAQQPVVTVINEGNFLAVQAVVSPDRQYVRMTVAPYFSKITDQDREFKFEGTDSVITNSTSASKGSNDEPSVTDERESVANSEKISTGTTIQQPIVSSFQVSTTVNVPDGGTVMLGGIKRLSEGRTEGGVPILSKIPYIKRLFTNASVGRETTSLMMMVTPRIIIKDEEEKFLVGMTEEDFNKPDGGALK